jgi:GrpB-like predicted nucleotidyltransferase (UPF0157 family)
MVILKSYTISEYTPEWKDWFLRITLPIAQFLDDLLIRAEHIGSTSVPGLAAKPVIDIDLVIDVANFEEVKKRLELMGYSHNGDQGVPGRETFKSDKVEQKNNLIKHHLYVCDQFSDELKRHLIFREFLKNNPEEVERYSAKKWELYAKTKDREEYIESKTSLVEEILERALNE